MKINRIFALVLAAIMTVSLLAACGGSSSATTAGGADNTTAAVDTKETEATETATYNKGTGESDFIADEVRLVGNEASATLYPWGTDISNTALFEIYETLFNFESYGSEMKPMLADASRGEFGGYDHEDGTTDYTVYIYDYIHDQAGNAITANDVKFSYDKQVELAAPGSTPWSDYTGCDVIDDTTITFHFARELTGLDDLTNFWPNCFIISEKAFKDSLGNAADENSALVTDACGTGPYKLVSYVNGSDTVLEMYEDYWQTDDSLKLPQQHANVKKITFVAATEAAQQVLALKTGTLDYVNEVNAQNLADFQNDNYTIYSWEQYGCRFLAPNCSEESICHDINMRLAIFYAIDLDGVAAALGGDTAAKRCYSLFSKPQSDYDASWESADNFYTVTDQAKVDEYLKAAGYNGETLVFIAGKKEQKAGEIITNMLTNAGITVELQVLDNSAFSDANKSAGSWDLLIQRCSGWCGAVSASRVFLKFSRYNDSTQNFVKDEEWFKLMDAILTTEGHTAENCHAWQQIANDNAYAMGVYALVSNVVYDSDITAIVRNGKNISIPGAFSYAEK